MIISLNDGPCDNSATSEKSIKHPTLSSEIFHDVSTRFLSKHIKITQHNIRESSSFTEDIEKYREDICCALCQAAKNDKETYFGIQYKWQFFCWPMKFKRKYTKCKIFCNWSFILKSMKNELQKTLEQKVNLLLNYQFLIYSSNKRNEIHLLKGFQQIKNW